MQTITPALLALLTDRLQIGTDSFAGRVEIAGVSYPCSSMTLDKNKRMQADQLVVELANEALALGWGATNIFPTNSRIKAFQWFGDAANEVQVFDGLIDNPIDHRDVLHMTLNCRGRFALLVDQTFVASAPQESGESGAVRTAANGVYLSMEVSDILDDILDRVGWPTADRHITATSLVIDEFIISDGSSYADAIIGQEQLTGLTGYDCWSDELGVFHFDPTPSSDIVEVPNDPVYTWRTGVDITELGDSTDQYELVTRVKTRGPLTTLKPSWTMLWQTTKVPSPVGIWYDPAVTTQIRVISSSTKKLYVLRDSDRQILSAVYLGSVIPHPLGISGDPADSTIYWVLNCPWKYGGGTSGNSVKKVRKSDNHLLASYSLPDGRWSAVKVSSSFMWLTNLDTDRFYKRSKTDASAIANYAHSYDGTSTFPQTGLGTAQTNPSGLMIDGTTLHLFWANGGTTARFLTCDESAPATLTGVVKTAGSTLHGGEMNTTTHTECWGDNDSLGLTAKFSLVTPVTTDVAREVVDTELEDELGSLAELENRVHDSHSGDAAHPWESRRMSLQLSVVNSIAQANDIAKFWLDKLGRRKRVLDAGIIGNPAVQINDLVRVEDPKTGIFQNWVLDTIHSEMSETFLATVSLVRGGVANDEITEPDPPPDDPPVIDPSDLSGHYYGVIFSGTFGNPGKGGATADLMDPNAFWNSIASTDTDGALFQRGVEYSYHWEVSGLRGDEGSAAFRLDQIGAAGTNSPTDTNIFRLEPGGAFPGTAVFEGTYTFNANMTADDIASAVFTCTSSFGDHPITITCWFDPV